MRPNCRLGTKEPKRRRWNEPAAPRVFEHQYGPSEPTILPIRSIIRTMK